ncbi:ATP-grasp domain-containing protein [Pseudomonas syringae]|uniref:ATP-grasp domain-containing protein n=1 Tax=Pseudomonas syringae TaxID=317 RepID=A0A085VC48_PSESX|nr:hypothetical protein [Pseudomonas syringae]KFE53011.1 hypothetical protein IV01_21305 [Pseudomonas syringae]
MSERSVKSVILFAPVKILLQHSQQEWLGVLGANSLIYTDQEGKALVLEKFPALSSSFQFYKNFNDSAVVEIDALFAAKRLGTKAVIALAESDMLRVARIKDRLSEALTHYEDATMFYRDKFLMKQRLAQHGLRINPMAVVRSACEIHDFVERYGYPVVVKPRDGRGSGGVQVLREYSALLEYLQAQACTTFHNLMIEKYIDAPLLNVNGLYIAGNPIIISPVRSTITCLEFLDGQSLGLQMLSEENPLHNECVKLTRRVIEQALPRLGTMMFHLEIFVDGGDLVVCEIACRLGGCSVNQELTEAYGVNPRLALINAEKGGESLSMSTLIRPLRLVGQLNIPPSSGKLTAFPKNIDLPFVRYCSVTANQDADYAGMKLTNSEIVSAIVDGDSERSVSDNLAQLDAWFRSRCVWD